MAEKCTNTSSPVERWINPYPFAPLNHFTVPFSLTETTPFAIAKNNSPGFLDRRLGPTEAPLKETDRKRLLAAVCAAWKKGKIRAKKEKTPQSSTTVRHRSANFRSPT